MTTITTTEKVEIEKSKSTTPENAAIVETLKHYVTQAEMQKEHKETTRLIVGVGLIIFAATVVTSALMTFGFNYTVGGKLDTVGGRLDEIQSSMKSMNVRIDELGKSNSAISSDLARLDGYVRGMSQTKDKP